MTVPRWLFFHSLCSHIFSFSFPFFALEPEATENNAANQPTEVPRTKKFTWKIENFSRITAKRVYSGIFDVGDYKW